jgi:hypothetical protein
MTWFNRAVASLTTTCMLGLSMPLAAHAQIVGTEEIASAAHTQQLKDQVRSALDRAQVQQALQQRGVDPAQLKGRVDALASHMDELPAGGDVLGLLFAVFVILLVTDILGLTKVFPFTRPVR